MDEDRQEIIAGIVDLPWVPVYLAVFVLAIGYFHLIEQLEKLRRWFDAG